MGYSFSAIVATFIHTWSHKESILLFKNCILVNLFFFTCILWIIVTYSYFQSTGGRSWETRRGYDIEEGPSKCKMSRTFRQMQIHSFKKWEALNININRATKGFSSVCFKSVVFTCIAMCIMGEMCFRLAVWYVEWLLLRKYGTKWCNCREGSLWMYGALVCPASASMDFRKEWTSWCL